VIKIGVMVLRVGVNLVSSILCRFVV